jgi:SAM-dependent methyltransferase
MAQSPGLWLRLLENSCVFALTQRLGRGTVAGYRALLDDNLRIARTDRVLDLGCGIGALSEALDCDYYGIDSNPHYIRSARRRFRGRFEVMDCAALAFPDAHFDHVISVAVFHHLDDAQVLATVREALRVCRGGGAMHAIDAILPIDAGAWLKRRIFLADRGRHPRRFEDLLGLIDRDFKVSRTSVHRAFPHDSCYIRVDCGESPGGVSR